MTPVLIEGAGLAGQVLHRELTLRGVPSRLIDKAAFPREKVCGGALQWDSWQYLKSMFRIPEEGTIIRRMSHFWRGRLLSRIELETPMVYVPRYSLDHTLNSQQTFFEADTETCIRVTAAGVDGQNGRWIGFQGSMRPVEELEMHYGRGVYLGAAPTPEGPGHAALIVKKNCFKTAEDLRKYVRKELGVEVTGSLKGTRSLHYDAPASDALAVGDAKLVTHPFLGLGMKHAILSARLMARCLASGRAADYAGAHRRLFAKYRAASRAAGILYDSPLRFILKPVLKHPPLFLGAYRWLHGQDEILKTIA